MALIYGGNNVTPTNKLGFGNVLTLASGQTWTISPAGTYWVTPGPYTCLQVYDPVSLIWRAVGGRAAGSSERYYIQSDGNNYRLANLTGCVVGAQITNVGSGYTSAPTVTISGQNSIWRAVVGGKVATPTIVSGGTNYTYPPVVTFSAPPAGGVQATGYATLTTGAVSAVTMVNVGAGYTSAPTITFTNDPREGVNGVTQGYGAAATTSLTGSGTVSALLCTDPGSGGLTAVPTLVFSGGGGSNAAATALCCFTVTSLPTPGGTNTGWTAAAAMVTALDNWGAISITSQPTNPEVQQGIVKTRNATLYYPVVTGALTATGGVIYDGGIYTGIPIAQMLASSGTVAAATTIAFTSVMGGVSDTSYISS